MPPAIIGAVVGGVASIGGSILSSKANSKAIGQASDAQAAATKEATQLQRDVYNQNVGYQTPYLNTGNAAMAQINALLGLSVPQSPAPAAPAQTLPANETQAPAEGGGDFFQNILHRHRAQQLAQTTPTPAPAPTVPQVTQPTAQAAYDQFKNYTGYQSRLNEANNAFNSAYAAKGSLQSGAALQALSKMNQDYASGEFGNYLGYLGGQQQLGPGAANALGGVGTNYANQAGNLAINQGNNAANAAIATANNRNQLYSGIASGIGGMAGSIFGGSSFPCDEQLKKDIVVVRVRNDGLPVKSWVYRNDPQQRRYEGHVAQDVAKVYPKAVIENFNGTGFLGVNYAEIPAEQGVAA